MAHVHDDNWLAVQPTWLSRGPIMSRSLITGVLILGLVLSATGCGLGKENILFVTKTSLGVDIDSKPPTLDISYTRREGTLSPEYPSGVLPQMASFATEVGVPVNLAVGQSIATGHAATLLAKYIGTPLDPELTSTSIPIAEITSPDASRIEGEIENGKRFFFGTDTAFGLRVTFGLETGGYPDSLSFGYKRKEMAFVPITEKSIKEGNVVRKTVGIPPLLATAGFDLQGKSGGGEVQYVQFFATGHSASYLAAKKAIRSTVGLKIIGDKQAAEKLMEATFPRSEAYASVEMQTRIAQLLERVNALEDAPAIELFENPPSTDENVEALLERRIGGVTVDGSMAREATKMRIAQNPQDDASLRLWEEAVTAVEQP